MFDQLAEDTKGGPDEASGWSRFSALHKVRVSLLVDGCVYSAMCSAGIKKLTSGENLL